MEARPPTKLGCDRAGRRKTQRFHGMEERGASNTLAAEQIDEIILLMRLMGERPRLIQS